MYTYSMYFTYPNFSLFQTKNFFFLPKGVRISEDALYKDGIVRPYASLKFAETMNFQLFWGFG